MKRLWNDNNVPELAALPLPERKRIWREARESVVGTAAFRWSLLVAGLCAGAGSFIGNTIYRDGVWGAAIGGGIGGYLMSRMQHKMALRAIREKLGKE